MADISWGRQKGVRFKVEMTSARLDTSQNLTTLPWQFGLVQLINLCIVPKFGPYNTSYLASTFTFSHEISIRCAGLSMHDRFPCIPKKKWFM